ncbi:MAG TPA: hypothetical protein VFF43_13055, partial [Caldimonas sp.]|nr:hypothetical protein [Caldimonas sp.]
MRKPLRVFETRYVDRRFGAAHVVRDRVVRLIARLVKSAEMLVGGEIHFVSFNHAIEREDRLVMLAVELVETAGLEQRRQMLEVRLAKHFDELV